VAEVTPGKDTSEYETLQKIRLWVVAISASASIAIVSLLASGAIPKEHRIFGVLTVAAMILGAIGGVSSTGKSFITGRSAVKANASLAEAAKAGPTTAAPGPQ